MNVRKYILNLFFSYWKQKQDILKKRIGRRYNDREMIVPNIGTININEIKIADILLCGPSISEKVNDIIQNTTDGTFIHCALYIGNDIIIDMTTKGIRRIKISNFIDNYSYIAIMRSQRVNLNIDAVINFAKQKEKRKCKYNWIGAILSPIKEYNNIKWFYASMPHNTNYNLKKPNFNKKSFLLSERYFCSELIMDCFKAADDIDKYEKYYKSDKWSPTGIAEDSMFSFMGYLGDEKIWSKIDKLDPFLMGDKSLRTQTGRDVHNKAYEDLMNIGKLQP